MGREMLQRKCASRYGSIVYTPRAFEAAMKALLASGYIHVTSPYWHDPAGKASRTARYQASASLLAHLHKAGGSLAILERNKGAEGIRLKDNDKRLIEYGDTGFANDARDKLRLINDMLEAHWADLALTDDVLARERAKTQGKRQDEATQPFDFAKRTVYRVFNNCDWEQGGRFYGAWWISVPSELRRCILIDGKRTVEVDYSGLHAAMLFAEHNLPIPDDPYQRCLTQTGGKAERSLVKRTFNALLNADSVNSINEIDGYSAQLTGKEWGNFKTFIVDCYPEFTKQFGTGVGLRLQCQDSDLAETVMLEFAAKGYACLPVHDGFVVHHALQDDLTAAMQKAFEAKFGYVGQVGFEIGEGETVEPSFNAIKFDPNKLLKPVGYEKRLQDFWLTKRLQA